MPKIPRRTNEKSGEPLLRGLAERIEAFGRLRALFHPVPEEWLRKPSRASQNGQPKEGSVIACKECTSYKELVNAWRSAVKWTDGLDHGLASMLASISSTQSVGDQLWLKVLGPASCGKSILCEALSVNTEYILAKSTIRGFHSGFNATGDASEDNSLIAQLFDKTLITKDGDTLLQSPNLPQILSEARDLYDSTSRTHYRNRMSKEYNGVRMTWLLCGTSSLRKIDSSELGERFLDCVIMDDIDEELEDEIGWRVINRAMRNLDIVTDREKPETQHDPDMAEAMALTGGYVSYLRENAGEVLPKIAVSEAAMKQCQKLGKFVAFMRARPSYLQEENAEREFSPRLISQLGRLAKCLAFVLNRKEIDDTVMQRVTRIALDTGRGTTLTIAKQLIEEGPSTVDSVAMNLSKTVTRTKALLRFMRQIGMVETFRETTKGVRKSVKWGLTEKIQNLYEEVIGE